MLETGCVDQAPELAEEVVLPGGKCPVCLLVIAGREGRGGRGRRGGAHAAVRTCQSDFLFNRALARVGLSTPYKMQLSAEGLCLW